MNELYKNKFAIYFVFAVVFISYQMKTIPANEIWSDQRISIDIAKGILNGDFPLVGYKHSNGMHSFPAFYYFITPLVVISDDPLFLYWTVSIINMIGFLLLANYLFSKFSKKTCFLFLIFCGTHIWTLYFSSFFWNPNYIPFFMSLFLLFLSKWINDDASVYFFHLCGILLNIMTQMMPQTIILIPAYAIILFILRKIPHFKHQVLHVIIQFIMVYPWIHFYMYQFNWEGFSSGGKIYKGFINPVAEYLNYLGGFGLTKEYTTYLAYGTNTYPNENLWYNLLVISALLLLSLIIYGSFKILKNLTISRWRLHLSPVASINNEKQRLLLSTVVINLSCLIYLVLGMNMVAYHYQFMAPVLALMLAILLTEYNYQKVTVSLFSIVIMIQAGFSYWRAYNEFKQPYVTDFGYSPKFYEYYNQECAKGSSASFIDRRGVFHLVTSGNNSSVRKCGDIFLVLRSHIHKSDIIKWILNEKFESKNLNFKDYQFFSKTKNQKKL